jgi:hypothetical protein
LRTIVANRHEALILGQPPVAASLDVSPSMSEMRCAVMEWSVLSKLLMAIPCLIVIVAVLEVLLDSVQL